MSRAKRHHYVPQFHLRLFDATLGQERIWRYDKTSDRILNLPIKDTAVIGNYYTVATADGPTDELERIFARVEAAAAPIIRRLCNATAPRFEVDLIDRMTLSMYLGLGRSFLDRARALRSARSAM